MISVASCDEWVFFFHAWLETYEVKDISYIDAKACSEYYCMVFISLFSVLSSFIFIPSDIFLNFYSFEETESSFLRVFLRQPISIIFFAVIADRKERNVFTHSN